MASLEPTVEELQSFATVQHVLDWAGLSAGASVSYLTLLGRPATLRVFACIPVEVFKTMIAGWRLPPTSTGTVGDSGL